MESAVDVARYSIAVNLGDDSRIAIKQIANIIIKDRYQTLAGRERRLYNGTPSKWRSRPTG
jgi:hypothetical protein